MPIVYIHRRNDTNDVFYVGIGQKEARAYARNRACRTNPHWIRVVNNHGYTVEIVMSDITWEQACFVERYLINHYGRRDLGLGSLVNFTDGGDGVVGFKHSDKTKTLLGEQNKTPKKMKVCLENMKKAHTPEAREKAKRNRDYKHIGDVQKKPITQFTMYGDIVSEWPSAKDAARSLNINYTAINNCTRGVSKSSGGFIWKFKH